MPDSVSAGAPLTIKLRYKVPADLGGQLVHVTLKVGREAKRVERQVESVSGEGVLEVTFQVPDPVPDNVVRFAAFIGKDHPNNLQYLQPAPVAVR